jgi:8-oxo-dGTP diphosphatase
MVGLVLDKPDHHGCARGHAGEGFGLTTVVAGVLRRDNRILICQRRADQPHALKWEFPGGKLEPGESPEQALVRELREELGIESTVGRELMRYQFAYPGKNPILLIFLEVSTWTGEIENRIFETVLWERAEAFPDYDFLEGDVRFLTCLQ